MTMKNEKAREISELVESFCRQHLNEELAACAARLCDRLSRSRNLDITRGKNEIWAASIVYLIARANFLFDPANSNFLTADIICDFFGTKKTTTGNKATVIERTFNIGIGDRNYCTREITESFSFIKTPGGFIIPAMMAHEMLTGESNDIEIEIANEQQSQEIDKFMAEKKRLLEEAEQARQERRAEINREIADKKQKKKEAEQAEISKRQHKLW